MAFVNSSIINTFAVCRLRTSIERRSNVWHPFWSELVGARIRSLRSGASLNSQLGLSVRVDCKGKHSVGRFWSESPVDCSCRSPHTPLPVMHREIRLQAAVRAVVWGLIHHDSLHPWAPLRGCTRTRSFVLQ
jgi:hypothetical protein